MSKERLEEIKENWNNVVWGIDKSDINWLIEQAERVQEYDNEFISLEDNRIFVEEILSANERYRDLLESIRYTQDVAKEIQAEKPNIKVITPDDLLQHMLRKVNKELESELE